MARDPYLIIRSTLEGLRSAFSGAASRHDAVQNRWVISEMGYNSFLSGPSDQDWSMEKLTGFGTFNLRNPTPIPVTEEQQKQILEERPDTQFGYFEGDSQAHYLEPAINSRFLFRGDGAGREEFANLANDAGFCLLQLLQNRKFALKLPELVPYDAIGSVRSISASTNLPSDLMERWLGFLHILGWQNLALLPLRAVRAIWHQNGTILGDPAELHRYFDSPMFDQLRERFPLPARYFASTITADLNMASVYAIDCLLSGMVELPSIDVLQLQKDLASIPPGRDDAARFHALVKNLLAIIFEPDLDNPTSEEKYHEGRGRIDIVFTNVAERGYFADLLYRHHIKCPVVFFECKNYSSDVSAPEFAQLTSRFSDKRSNVGFIVCRTIDNREAIQKRCRDRFQDKQEHILVLEDADLVELLKLKAQGDTAAISRLLHTMFRPVFMDSVG